MDTYFVTGASRGIGRSIAISLAASDCRLYLHGRDRKNLERSCQLAAEKGAETHAIVADLSDEGGVDTCVREIGKEPIKGLINNAGMAVVKPLSELTLADWQKTFAVNVTAPFLLTQRLLPLMKPGSSIVNILSTAARQGFPNWSSYCMSKFAMEGFSQAIREEVRSRGIRVINIYPAATDTDIWNDVPGEWARDKMMSPDEVGEAVAFALKRPPSVLVENITIGNTGGAL